MKPKAIVWDVDDVLTPTSLAFHAAAMRTHGQCLHPDEWTDYWWGKHVGLDDHTEIPAYLTEHRIIETTEPYMYTTDALVGARLIGLKNILLSARAWHPNPRAATTEWAARYVLDPYIHDMHFVEVSESKRHRLEEICQSYEVVAFVEDNPDNAIAALDLVDQVFLVRRNWNVVNQTDDRVISVATALEAVEVIVRSQITQG